MPPSAQGSLGASDFIEVSRWNVQSSIVSHTDPLSDYSIFFVHRLEQFNLPFVTLAYTPIDLRDMELNAVIFPDGEHGQTLAHECGHFLLKGARFLNSTHHSNGRNDLMQESPGPTALKIPKNQANFMNPSGFP